MSVFDALDATRLCSRWSVPPADAAWTLPSPVSPARVTLPPAPRFSWWALARNPQALLLTGMVGSMAARDALRRAVTV